MDISERQLEHAAALLRESGYAPKLFVSPMEQNPGLPQEYFDVVYSVYAIGWTTDLHLFVAKMRKLLSVPPHIPGSAPYVDSPVSLDEYLDAYEKIEKGKPVENPHIMAMPDKPQQIMTIGLILDLISCFMTKIGEIMKALDFKLKNMADSFNSHASSKIRKVLEARTNAAKGTG